MVKAMGNLNRWLDKELIQEMFGWSPENIDLLINGLSRSIAKTSDGLIMINLSNLRNYLFEVKKLADPILEGSVSKKIKKPEEEKRLEAEKKPKKENKLKAEKKPKPERMNRKKRAAAGQLTGGQVAKKINCSYQAILEFIEKHGLKGDKFGRGWYIKSEVLEEFLSKNQDLIKSFQSVQEEKKDDPPEEKHINPEKDNNTEDPAPEDKKEEEIARAEEDKIQEDKEQEKNKENESSEKDSVQPSASLSDPAIPEESAVTPDPNPDQTSDSNQENTEDSDLPPIPVEDQRPENQEAIQSSEPESKKDSEEEAPVRYVTIKKGKYGCKIDDVAMALRLQINTPMKWIEADKVSAVKIIGTRGEEYYILSESLREFLRKERNTEVTFDETKNYQWPDSSFTTRAKTQKGH
ncbi:MAG: hypothetical protein E4H47_02215 [Parcubacteria group bacterium]|nr:MAG: hypothetical protein E4H47_02215 [Parcubacteria group bacterium]